MCEGSGLLADFVVGTGERPHVPDAVSTALTETMDGACAVWAHKLAHRRGDMYRPLRHGTPYPADAVAVCGRGGAHRAPELSCTCGFHALSSPWPSMPMPPGLARLDVLLSGRVLAFEWPAGGVLFRAERQTVVRARESEPLPVPPDDPGGRLVRRRRDLPRGSGPVRLRVPPEQPVAVQVSDDAGYCYVGAGSLTRSFALV